MARTRSTTSNIPHEMKRLQKASASKNNIMSAKDGDVNELLSELNTHVAQTQATRRYQRNLKKATKLIEDGLTADQWPHELPLPPVPEPT